MAIPVSENVKINQTIQRLTVLTGPLVGSGGGGGGGGISTVDLGRISNLEKKADTASLVAVGGYAPFAYVGATVSHGVTVWTAVTSGTQITDLKNWDGTTASSLTSDSSGGVYFQAPVANAFVYIDLGSTRLKVDRTFTIVHTHAISDVTSLQASLDAKSDTTHNHNSSYLAVSARGAANGVASLDGSTKVPTAQIPDLSATYIAASQKAAASGVAPLDGTSKVPLTNLPTNVASTVTSVNGHTGPGAVVITAADASAVDIALIGQPNGVAALDSGGLVPSSQLPAASGNIPLSQKGVASGVATLTSGTKHTASEIPSSTPAVIQWNGTAYATRSTVTADSTRPVIWKGPNAPTIGGSYAVDNVDIWFRES